MCKILHETSVRTAALFFSMNIVFALVIWSTLPFNELKLTWKPKKMLSRTFRFFLTAQDLKTHLAECKSYCHIFTRQAFYNMQLIMSLWSYYCHQNL